MSKCINNAFNNCESLHVQRSEKDTLVKTQILSSETSDKLEQLSPLNFFMKWNATSNSDFFSIHTNWQKSSTKRFTKF